jgi:carboxyl-terminal processing protease
MRYIFLSLSIFILFQIGFSQSTGKKDSVIYEYRPQKPLPVHPRNAQLIMYILEKNHYKKMELNDEVSSQIFDNYLRLLDAYRSYFLKSDIAKIERFRHELDDFIKGGHLTPVFEIYNQFQTRFKERYEYVYKRLERPFNFSANEQYKIDRSEQPWLKTKAQLDSVWEQRVKNEYLNLKLTDKEHEKIVEIIKKRYQQREKNIKQTESEDVFQWFMNSFAETYDPHTAYMSPKRSEDFAIRMSLALEGIGAQLRTENDYTTIVKIIPGGPADKSDLLHENDKITAVAQGEEGELVDVVGWRIDDVVQLIRGKKGTTVKLQIIPAESSVGAEREIITIIRDKVKLEDSAATSDTLIIKKDGFQYSIGVISIPSFYFDYEAMRNGNRDFKSTTRDVRKLIGELKAANVDGIVVDLRNNGGGFLSEAVELSGLFLEEGPVVQVKNTRGMVSVERDTDNHIMWEGPLAVIVNRFSASASEIFAAAIKDYKRGVIIGNQSFGKGTVQNVVNLSRYFPGSKEKFGKIKMTIAKFYRINGGSTQHKGVLPHLSFPSRYQHIEVGENAQKNALQWDEIPALNYALYDHNLDDDISRLKLNHSLRLKENPEYLYLLEDIDEIKKEKEKEYISLNYEIRAAEREKNEKKKKERKAFRDKTQTNDADFVLDESANALVDYIQIEGVQ